MDLILEILICYFLGLEHVWWCGGEGREGEEGEGGEQRGGGTILQRNFKH